MDSDGKASCQVATPVQAEALTLPPLTIINPHSNPNGLTILIAASVALQANPSATSAFLRAAQSWESVIASKTTLIIGADFGSTDPFGKPFANNVLGGSVPLTNIDFAYTAVRPALAASASNDWDKFLYAGLPVSSLMTDIGTITSVSVPTSLRRAWGVLPAASATAGDLDGFIGYNSAFPFDFDRTNGISALTYDFEATATHEMGHALGFESTVGDDLLLGIRHVAVLDLFRFRPGTTSATYAGALRIQTAGGDQEFWNSQYDTPLSTGRRDESGGSHQAGHWLDNFESPYIYWGIMDPVLIAGIPSYLTVDDLIAFDMIGYAIQYPSAPATPTNLVASAQSTTAVALTWQNHSTNQSELRLEVSTTNGPFREYASGVPSNRSSLTIDALAPDTTYSFRIIATNAGGYSGYSNVASAHTLAQVCQAPIILNQPTNQTVSRGGAVTYHIGVAGTAPITYQWYAGVSGNVSVPIIGATFNDIVFGPIDGTYFVWMRATNTCGHGDTVAAQLSVTLARRRAVRH